MMTTQDNATDDPVATEGEAEGIESVTPAELNRYAKAQKAAADEANKALIKVRFEQLDLDPDKGLGKAVIASYEGGTSKEEVAKFLKDEYDYEPPESVTVPTPTEQAQATVDGLASVSESVAPVSQEDPLIEVTQRLVSPEATRQDAQNSLTLKVNKYLETLSEN
jgi:hypothetical protein